MSAENPEVILLITNSLEVTHGHKYLQEWGLSEELPLCEESLPNYAILKKNAPRLSVSSGELLPTWCRVAAAAQMAEAKCMPPGSRPHLWGVRCISWECVFRWTLGRKKPFPVWQLLQRNKSFFKKLFPCLQIAHWGSLSHTSLTKKTANCCYQPAWDFGAEWTNATLTQSIHEPERISRETHHPFDMKGS